MKKIRFIYYIGLMLGVIAECQATESTYATYKVVWGNNCAEEENIINLADFGKVLESDNYYEHFGDFKQRRYSEGTAFSAKIRMAYSELKKRVGEDFYVFVEKYNVPPVDTMNGWNNNCLLSEVHVVLAKDFSAFMQSEFFRENSLKDCTERAKNGYSPYFDELGGVEADYRQGGGINNNESHFKFTDESTEKVINLESDNDDISFKKYFIKLVSKEKDYKILVVIFFVVVVSLIWLCRKV